MRTTRSRYKRTIMVAIGAFVLFTITAFSIPQESGGNISVRRAGRGPERPVTIPVTIRLRQSQPQKEVQLVDLVVRDDRGEQPTISIRRLSTTPLPVAALVQDDLVSSVSNKSRTIPD